MNDDSSGYKDPFAGLDDGFGDDDFSLLDDGLGDSSGAQEDFAGEMPLNDANDYDQFGNPIEHDQSAPAYAEQDQQQEYVAPAAAAPAAQPAASKPFLKTPIGIASLGAGVVVLGIVSTVVISAIGGSEEVLTEAAPPVPSPLAPVAGDQNFNANTQPTQSATAVITQPMPPKRLPTPAEQLAGAAPVPVPVEPSVPRLDAGQPTLKLAALEEAPAISVSDEVARLKSALNHQKNETESLKSTLASLTQGMSKLSAYAEKDHEEQAQIRVQLEALSKRFEEAPKQEVAAVPAPKAPETPRVEGQKAEGKPAENLQNPKAAGRYRLPGLKVVEVTESGKMAIVTKVSNGRTFTLFKGERLGTPRGSMKVTEVKDDGFLILVGDTYYIDKVAESKPEAVPVVAAPKPEKPARRVVTAKQKQVAPSVDASGYTLNAVYDSGQSFGLVNPAGDFKSYRIGDDLPGVGRITGLDDNGNLRAGSKVIKSLY